MPAAWVPAAFTDVTIEGGFWGPRLRANREQTLPYEFEQLTATGRLEALGLTWAPGRDPKPHIFWDSDVAKWVEAASCSLATHPDSALEARLEQVVGLIVAAQQADGYLNTYFTAVEPERRWKDLRNAHELYCAGHLIEAGVAHFQATGRRRLLAAVTRYADYIGRVFGRGPGQVRGYSGHEEIELALVRLWRATGERRHLELARYFVDERGQQPLYWAVEAGAPGDASAQGVRRLRDAARYNQSHLPVRAQSEATGHAVRAMYLYSAMADLAGILDDAGLRAACERLWEDVTGHHMYLTGGIGSSASNEGFTADFDLPNAAAYAETCASVGLALWAHRLLQLECDGRYGDVLERALYNGVQSGVGLDGRSFFYANPLASDGRAHRQPWFGCACCPPNLARLLASLGGRVCSVSADGSEAAVHLYVQGESRLRLAGGDVRLRQSTDYPWDGHVALEIGLDAPARLGLRLRVPAWARRAEVRVNGADAAVEMVRGYARLERVWQPGDRVEMDLPMPVERVYAHPDVQEDAGRVALQRGPLVYCFEEADNPGVPLHRVWLPKEAELRADFAADLLGGMVAVTTQGQLLQEDGPALYRHAPAGRAPVALRAVPYCAWDNRAPGAMRVWLPEAG